VGQQLSKRESQIEKTSAGGPSTERGNVLNDGDCVSAVPDSGGGVSSGPRDMSIGAKNWNDPLSIE